MAAKKKTAKRTKRARTADNDDGSFLVVTDTDRKQVFVGTALPVIKDNKLWERIEKNGGRTPGTRRGSQVLIVDGKSGLIRLLGGNLQPSVPPPPRPKG